MVTSMKNTLHAGVRSTGVACDAYLSGLKRYAKIVFVSLSFTCRNSAVRFNKFDIFLS